MTLEICNKADLFMPEYGNPGFSVSMRNQLRLYITVLNWEIDIADFAFFLEFSNANYEDIGDSIFLDEAVQRLKAPKKDYRRVKRGDARQSRETSRDTRNHADGLDEGEDMYTKRPQAPWHLPAGELKLGSARDRRLLDAKDAAQGVYASTCVRDAANCCERFAQCDACSGAPRGWHNTLPVCPCTYEQTCPAVTRCRCTPGSKDLDCIAGISGCTTQNVCAGGWRQADYLLVTWDKARHGAHKCVEQSHGSHAQRCCYDVAGKLITRGPGAGVFVCLSLCMPVCVCMCLFEFVYACM
jgi:hypothetical protein